MTSRGTTPMLSPTAQWNSFALPCRARVYTVSQMNYLIDRICWLYDNRELIGGLKFETEGPHNFYDKLNSVSDWPEKLAAKFRMDFGDSL